MIDWTNPGAQVTAHFTVKDALWLPQWGRMATEADGLTDDVKVNLQALFQVMESVRTWINCPIRVHCAYRPAAYNALPSIKGAPNSAHLALGSCAAVDFDAPGVMCDGFRFRALKENKLDEWLMRMEDRPGSNWVHLDTRALLPGHARFFKP